MLVVHAVHVPCAMYAVFNRVIMSSGTEWHSTKGLKMVREQVL